MKTIYLVEGRTGSYEDRCSWIVKAFTSEQSAENFISQLKDEFERIKEKHDGSYIRYWSRPVIEENRLDPKFQWIDIDTEYYCIEVQLEED